MIQDVEGAIRKYLPNIIHMSLATSRDNKPWVCEVHYAFDDDLNLYFRSLQSTRHGLEIAANPNVAGSIVTQHMAAEKPRGVYFEGIAELLQDVDKDHPAFVNYCQRFGTDTEILDDANTINGHKFYKVSVNKFYLFDSHESSPSKKYELAWNKS